ncbi:Ribosomal protein S6--L-glutamate ligase [BD1-7 clade bacterium]|uniref:Ribosomal protein S6--L-glutamate ligase n=1 Tax=BD1-7 clade bacterium TaxID=2029982 RepID=A0A5S9N3H2_9GAMM|nr:Ribosomal protein S6--L-glutamate ligase [BD1-7 clade bacterium]
MLFAKPSKLREKGLLGMNERNVSYIGPYNDRKHYPNVDDKLKTKVIAENAGIAVPKLLHVIEAQYQVKTMAKVLDSYEEFVIKPSKGSAGKGIMVIRGKRGENWIMANGDPVSLHTLQRHVSNILSGLYSLGGKPDVAMFESLVQFDPIFENYSYQGVPDIRVIVFKGYPIMAMLRLSTKASDGKANLHQGAIGVGINIATGKSVNAVQFDLAVSHHPDTGHNFKLIEIPHWDTLLHLSSCCYEVTDLGYIGTDIVLDKNLGPLILELNARPGLAIQIANDTGLKPRLKLIEEQAGISRTVEERVAFAKAHFGDTPI